MNESYFEQIESPSKAYWLGFLFGDGSLVERKYGCQDQLSQGRDDLSHLLKFKRTVRSENAIVEDRETCHLRISNRTFAANLRKYGFTSTKSTDEVLPDLETWPLKRGFVRGLWDADGYNGTTKWTITDNTSKRLRKLQSRIPFESDVIEEQYGDRSWANLRVSGKRAIPALYHWLIPWGDQTEPALAQKREPALDLLTEHF